MGRSLEEELLAHIWVTSADADPLVRRLADFLTLRLEDKADEPDETGDEETLNRARDDGWQHGLGKSLELVEDEIDSMHARHRSGRSIPLAEVSLAEASLARIANAISTLQTLAPDECSRPQAERSAAGEPRQHGSPNEQRAAHPGTTAKEMVLKMIPPGRSELRENVTRVLTQEHRLKPSAVAQALRRLLDDGTLLREVEVGRHKVLERVA